LAASADFLGSRERRIANSTCDFAIVLWSAVNDSCMSNTMVLMNVSVELSASIFRVTEHYLLIHLRRKKPNALHDVKTPKRLPSFAEHPS